MRSRSRPRDNSPIDDVQYFVHATPRGNVVVTMVSGKEEVRLVMNHGIDMEHATIIAESIKILSINSKLTVATTEYLNATRN